METLKKAVSDALALLALLIVLGSMGGIVVVLADRYVPARFLYDYEFQDRIKIAKVIRNLSPEVTERDIKLYADLIVKYSLQYNVDWKIAVALFKQESNFNKDAVNYESRDFGIGQLNYRTIQHRNVNLGKLMTDEDYAISYTFAILSELRGKYAKMETKRGAKWWSRYHSYTSEYRRKYSDLIEKHLVKIEKIINGK